MEENTAVALHQTVTHAAQHTEAHELPNLITILDRLYPDTGWAHFLHRWENIIFSLIPAVLIIVTAILAAIAAKKNLIPRGIQNLWESLVESVSTFVTSILGKEGLKHTPYLGTVFIYILLDNILGLFPLMKSPTSSWSTTLALALSTLVYIHYAGIKEQGLPHYLKHMAGNPVNLFGFILIPLMLVINLTVEFVAVPLSLSLRLFANVSSEDRLLLKFAELNVTFHYLPFFFQLFANILAIVFSFVQAFVFMLLSTVYISLILPHEDHGPESPAVSAH